MARPFISSFIAVLVALLLVLAPALAQAKFSMAKYRYTLDVFNDDGLKSDYNNINNWKRNTYGPRLVADYGAALKAAKPTMHKDDVQREAEDRRDAYFKKNETLLGAASKLDRKKEIWKIIESFEDIELERLKNFFVAYPLFRKAILSYDNVVLFSRHLHAIFTPDHKQKWDIATDLAVQFLKERPSYITFADKDRETEFYNNLVNYMTNNFKVEQLEKIREFFRTSLGQRYLKVAYETFEERVKLVEAIYSENYAYYAALPQEQKSDREFQ